MENKVAILDLDSIVFSCGYAKDFIKPNKMLEEHTDNLMTSILDKCCATHYIGYIKGSNTTKHRLLANPDYKGNRAKGKPVFWDYTKQYLIEKWKAVEVNEIEVDDAVNITRLNLKDSFIVAIDKDLLMLEGKHYNWRKDEWFENTEESANYKFLLSLCTGDSVDNIKGLPGKGIKWFEDRFKGYIPTIGSLLDEYILQFGENKGIDEFYKNYKSLKMLDEYEDLVIPEPILWNKNDEQNNVWI